MWTKSPFASSEVELHIQTGEEFRANKKPRVGNQLWPNLNQEKDTTRDLGNTNVILVNRTSRTRGGRNENSFRIIRSRRKARPNVISFIEKPRSLPFSTSGPRRTKEDARKRPTRSRVDRRRRELYGMEPPCRRDAVFHVHVGRMLRSRAVFTW